MIKCRCEMDTLFGYCKESNGQAFFISFPSPCNKGMHLLVGQPIETCPNYLTSVQLANYHGKTNDYLGVTNGVKASFYKDPPSFITLMRSPAVDSNRCCLLKRRW